MFTQISVCFYQLVPYKSFLTGLTTGPWWGLLLHVIAPPLSPVSCLLSNCQIKASKRLMSGNNGQEEQAKEKRISGHTIWRKRYRKKERRRPAVTFPLCVGDAQHSSAQASWLPDGENVISVRQHTSTHNPLPLFTLDQLQSSSSPN